MNKPVYLVLSKLEISKNLIYEFWYMDTDSFTIHIKPEDVYEDIENDVEKRSDTSNYAIKSPLPIGKNKNVIAIINDELGEKIMTEFVGFRPKTYAYLIDDGNSDKAKLTKKCVIKRILKFNDQKNCLLNNEIILKLQQIFKSEAHNVYTEKIIKIRLSSNDYKGLHIFDKNTSYPYGANVGKVCKTELLEYLNVK